MDSGRLVCLALAVLLGSTAGCLDVAGFFGQFVMPASCSDLHTLKPSNDATLAAGLRAEFVRIAESVAAAFGDTMNDHSGTAFDGLRPGRDFSTARGHIAISRAANDSEFTLEYDAKVLSTPGTGNEADDVAQRAFAALGIEDATRGAVVTDLPRVTAREAVEGVALRSDPNHEATISWAVAHSQPQVRLIVGDVRDASGVRPLLTDREIRAVAELAVSCSNPTATRASDQNASRVTQDAAIVGSSLGRPVEVYTGTTDFPACLSNGSFEVIVDAETGMVLSAPIASGTCVT
ncbi:MAG: hypothetical protein ACYDCK_12645 [Thermoplasmatota archaeon]